MNGAFEIKSDARSSSLNLLSHDYDEVSNRLVTPSQFPTVLDESFAFTTEHIRESQIN